MNIVQQHSDQFLLATKLSIPQIHAGLVARPRLFEQLQVGMQRSLTLLAAPAGFGKTMLLSMWIQESKRLVGWVSLDSNDNDPTQFWAYVITALDKLHPGIGKTPLSLLQSAQSAPVETVLITLVNALSTFQQDSALVLDDYHVIEASSIHNAMTFLLEHLPPTVHLLIASRVDPPLPLGRLRVRRQLTELRADDLRFTPEEAAMFLNEVMGLSLTAHDIAALETRTEGWVAGLQLAALSMQGKKDIASFVTAFTGSHRYIVDYLTEEVLRQQPEAVRAFLLQTSILDRMCAPLCDAVTARTESQTILEQLEHANLFLIPLDDERHWYRYHHLFADVLRYRLAQSQADLIPTLHKRASAWFEHNQLIVEAVNSALAAKDFEDAARLVNLISNSLIQRGEYVTLLRWLEANPEDVLRAHPLLCLQYAWILLFTGQIEAHERPLHMAEQTWLSEGNTAMLGRVCHFRMNMARLQGDATRTVVLAHEALSLLPENDLYNRSSCLVAIGASHLLLGHLLEAQQYLTKGRALNPAPVNLITVLLATNLLGDLQVVRGNLHEAAAIYQDVLQRADERPIWQVAEAHIGIGNILREWNQLEDAAQSLQQALALAQQTWREVYLAPGYITFAQILEARGQLAQANENLAKAVEVAQRLGHLPALRRAKAQQARLNLAQGNLPLTEQWCEATGIREDEALNYEHEIEYLVLARLRIAQNRADDALRLLDRLLVADETAGRMNYVIQNLVLQVRAHHAMGKPEQAMKALEQALSLTEPQGYIRVFVDEGLPMREVVSRFLALSSQSSRTLGKSISREYIQKLLAAFPQIEVEEAVAHSGMRATQHSTAASLLEPLSIREQEVLELLAAGMSNQEIARRLVVTEGTVKTHIKSIYGKLGVHSRTQAVARARELNLL